MFITSTVIRAASGHCRLALNAAHHLDAPNDAPPRKTRFPDDVDVILASDLVFTLNGVLDGVQVSPTDVLKSQLAQHLVDYFQANATELGIAPVSSMYIGQDGRPQLKVVSSRCLIPESELRRVHVVLVGIDLNYVWHTSNSNSTSLIHPFATHLSLPFQLLLDNVIPRFFTWHLVRRYPLIFGPWCQQLETERPYFDKIFRAISAMIARSPNPSFRKKCTLMLRTIQEQHAGIFTAATSSLGTYFGLDTDSIESGHDDRGEPELTDQEAFSLSMEMRYRICLRRPQFKGSTRTPRADDTSDDEELSQDQSLLTPESSQRFDENYLWHNVSTSAADFGFDFDLPLVGLPSVANIDRCEALDMGMEIEYHDPSEVWSDVDGENDDWLSLSSDNETPACTREAEFQDLDMDLSDDDGFSLVTLEPPRAGSNQYRELRLDLDVNMDRNLDGSHADRSPDAPGFRTRWTGIESLSPPAVSGRHLLRQDPTEMEFSGLSSKHCQDPAPSSADVELCFDSDSSSEPHDLEEFADVLHGLGTGHHRDGPEELEHQVGNVRRIATDGGADGRTEMEEMDGEALYFGVEDW
ncbi:hypothetical protein C8R44DRAFT_770452 [Mycena epipterygia]|nr:hypothetical protein C8R44DRAFT_770452 [Mycena epipterygia]